MRSRAATAAALLMVSVACNGGGGGATGRAGRPPATTPATTRATASAATATTAATVAAPPTTAVAGPSGSPPGADPPGSVTLHAASFTLPPTDPLSGAGPSGLRVLVRPASAGLTVRRRGDGEPVTACPVTSVAGPVTAAACVDLSATRAVAVAAWGVELRATATATGATATVDEVTVTYVPADRSLTLVTPAWPAGACPARACQATFSLSPPQPGTFSLDGRAGSGRPTLVLSSNSGPGGSIRTLATVQGGGNLSISAALDGASEVDLAYRDESSGAVPALTAEILWP